MTETRTELKSIQYMGNITTTAVIVQDLLHLYEENRERIERTKIELSYRILAEHPDFVIEQEDNTGEKLEAKITGNASEQVEKYKEWILNQSLVSFCSYFDAFLEDTLDLIFQVDQSLILDTKAADKVHIKDIFADGINNTVAEIRRKEVSRFAFIKGIDGRLGYYESKLGIILEDIFDWKRFTEESTESDWNIDKLTEAYDKRHGIIHRQEYPIAALEEVHEYTDMFSKLILNIGFLCMEKYPVKLS